MSCCGSSYDEPIKRKIVIVGDGACGKTCLLSVFCNGSFPNTNYIPTIFETSVKDMVVDSYTIATELWDTAGQEDYDRLRTLSYPDSDVIILAFSVDIPESLENITEKWVPEVKRYCHGLPIILVACKIDLRSDQTTIQELSKQSEKVIDYEQGVKMAKEVGAYKYIECSAKEGLGVQEVFVSAVKSTMKNGSGCTLFPKSIRQYFQFFG
ncbi:P-loop containing nucleoside triphosphate hydrolase protein [Sporodiniella umbellata]|nr:P-loop containing nucleoside triphosphate hydrolase protein [Sporodiniella umbellata]